MAKSRDAFRTISEVSDWLDTPAHVLRFWESKFTQIKPVKRAGGRRYYRPQDMALLGGIKTLLHDQGMTIKGAQKLLRDEGVKHVSALGPQPGDTQEASLAGIGVDVTPSDQPVLETKAPPISEPAPAPIETELTIAAEEDLWPKDPQDTSAADINDDILTAQTPAEDTQTADPAPTRPARSIPALPDSAGAQARPGLLSIVLTADPVAASKNLTAITPLAVKLAEAHDRMSAA